MPLGPVMLDIAGLELTDDDRRRLLHPETGGMILFSRNFASKQQLRELTAQIHALRDPRLIIAVDHEGGRVQRFRQGFTALPPMRELGRIWDAEPERAREVARQVGWLLAAELGECGIDLSFTPVLDMDYGTSSVIGDRAFHSDPRAVAELARHLIQGLREAGMGSVGKHFPGHGYIEADSHLAIPVDERGLDEMADDILPFRETIAHGLTAIMPAHVIYPKVDANPAGFSGKWLKGILRGVLGFSGMIFSDDLSMEGASVAGNVVQRARAALTAGCDMALVCNAPDAADRVLAELSFALPPAGLARLAQMHGRPNLPKHLQSEKRYLAAVESIAALGGAHGIA
ncbi:MAG: beta-N-acetylhexosaminidase [Burkholderiales bacterium]|nr:beta-N-acetylhexosaminidase [Burkholderiales bacterium]